VYKTDVIRKVAQETRMSQRDVNDALTGAITVITQALSGGETVTFPGFGTFYTSQRKAAKAKNFRTGKPVDVPARRVAAFRVGSILKSRVRGKARSASLLSRAKRLAKTS
jgi:DNA-binding protein HU-beta